MTTIYGEGYIADTMTDTVQDIPLPEPALTSYVTDSVMRSIECKSWTADQMRAYGDAREAAARERCANLCDDMTLYTGFDCANAIREA